MHEIGGVLVLHIYHVTYNQGCGVVVVLFRLQLRLRAPGRLRLRLRLRVWRHFTLARSNDQPIQLKGIDQGLRYPKDFKSLSFIVAPMLARQARKRRYSRKFHRKNSFLLTLTGQIAIKNPESESRQIWSTLTPTPTPGSLPWLRATPTPTLTPTPHPCLQPRLSKPGLCSGASTVRKMLTGLRLSQCFSNGAFVASISVRAQNPLRIQDRGYRSSVGKALG